MAEEKKDPDEFRIYDHFDGDIYDKSLPPLSKNYVSGLRARLFPIHTFVKGRILQIQYFAQAVLDASGQEVGTTLIVEENYKYTVDAAGFARGRELTITWIKNDGSVGEETKTRRKIYNNAASRTEGRRRRRNVIDQLSIAVAGMLMVTQTAGNLKDAVDLATPWMDALSADVQAFLELSSPKLVKSVTEDIITAWLDDEIAANYTIRDHIISELA